MSTALGQPPTPPAPPRGSLLRAEAHRFRARRFVRVIAGLALLGWLAATAISLTQFGTPTATDVAAARAEIDRIVAENEEFRQQCLTDPARPDGIPVDEFCGPPLAAGDLELRFFLDDPPFSFTTGTEAGALAFAAGTAVLAFVLGATWIGAEWSTRSLVSLLFWEPRRSRVMAAKLAVLVLGAALLAVAAQLAWLATAVLLDAVAGDGRELPTGFWAGLLGTQARAVLLVVLAAVGGFGLATLVRGTGAALGIGFVYVAVVESAIGAVRPLWQPWLLTTNAAALLLPGGNTVFVYEESVDARGELVSDVQEIVVGSLQGGLVLTAAAAVAVTLGVLLFAHRDVH